MLRSRPVHLRGAGANNVPIPTIAISPLRSCLRNNNTSSANSNTVLPLYTPGAVAYPISQCRNISSARYLTPTTSPAAAPSARSSRERFNFPANGLIPAVHNAVVPRVQLPAAQYHSKTSPSARKPPRSKSFPDQVRNRDTRFGARGLSRSYPKSQSRAPFKPSHAKNELEERPEYSPRDRNRDTRFGAKSSPRSHPKSHSRTKSQSRGSFKPFQTKDEVQERPDYSPKDQNGKEKSYDPKALSAMAMRKDVYERAMAGIAKRRLAFANHVERVFYKGGFEKALSLVISAEKFSVNAQGDNKVHCDSAWNFLLDQMTQRGETDGAIRVFNYVSVFARSYLGN